MKQQQGQEQGQVLEQEGSRTVVRSSACEKNTLPRDSAASRPRLICPRGRHPVLMSDRIGLDIGGSLGKIVYFQPHAAGSHDLDAFIFGSSQYETPPFLQCFIVTFGQVRQQRREGGALERDEQQQQQPAERPAALYPLRDAQDGGCHTADAARQQQRQRVQDIRNWRRRLQVRGRHHQPGL